MEVTKFPEHLVFGLDIGTRSIVGTVGYRVDDQEFVVVAQSIRYHETRAMIDGQIHDIGKVAETIFEVKKELEATLGVALTKVCIAAAGRVLKTVTVHVDYELPMDMTVTKEQIHALELLGVEKAYEDIRIKTTDENMNFYCVAYTVVKYYLNDYMMTNLLDHKASKISADLLATFLPDEVIEGLYLAVEKVGLEVVNLTLEPIAAINVAIPEKFRLLNIALIDVGAGTSDISITKDGSIVAYGMIPMAGDAITEAIVQKHLVEFKTAEEIKTKCLTEDIISYEDILGIPHEVSKGQVLEDTNEVVDTMARRISDCIKECNAGKSVSAVFVVGGGGKIPTFTKAIAKYLELPEERVALRGEEVLREVTFLQPEVKKDSLLVTPIGICLNYYEQKNNFIHVQVNGQRVKLYDNNKLSIMDAAIGVGFPNELLFPRRGKSVSFTLDGVKRMKRGQAGEAAVIWLNGNVVGMNASIASNDIIKIQESTIGQDATLQISELMSEVAKITFYVNQKEILCDKLISVNGNLVSDTYEVDDGDLIDTNNYYTLKQLLEWMDIPYKKGILVNQMPAGLLDKVYDNFTVYYPIGEETNRYEVEIDGLLEDDLEHQVEARETIDSMPLDTETKEQKIRRIYVYVNGEKVALFGKESYILVDILDVYAFDLTTVRGNRVVITCNGENVDFTKPINEGDDIKLYWEA